MIVDLDFRSSINRILLENSVFTVYNTVVSTGFSKTNYLTSRWKSEIVKQSTMSTIIFTAYDLNQASKKKPYLNLWSNPSWSQPIYDPEHNNIPRSLTREDVWKRIYSTSYRFLV